MNRGRVGSVVEQNCRTVNEEKGKLERRREDNEHVSKRGNDLYKCYAGLVLSIIIFSSTLGLELLW